MRHQITSILLSRWSQSVIFTQVFHQKLCANLTKPASFHSSRVSFSESFPRCVSVHQIAHATDIYTSHKFHNASDKYPPMHYFVTEMYIHAHFCYRMVHCRIRDWCIVGFAQHDYWIASPLLKLTASCVNNWYLTWLHKTSNDPPDNEDCSPFHRDCILAPCCWFNNYSQYNLYRGCCMRK